MAFKRRVSITRECPLSDDTIIEQMSNILERDAGDRASDLNNSTRTALRSLGEVIFGKLKSLVVSKMFGVHAGEIGLVYYLSVR